jgi:hypothetical protein
MTETIDISRIMAGIKSVLHFSAALVILYFLYRVANGQFTLL